jgi:hypothetical protein
VSEFVEECRREWKRLGVPDPVANEMAADLAADLEEADADGVSAEEVLGSSAFDPRAFAGAWAAERGVVGSTPEVEVGPPAPRRRRLPAPIIAFALVALAGLVIAGFGPSGGGGRVVAAPFIRPAPVPFLPLKPRLVKPPQSFVVPGQGLVPGGRVIAIAAHGGLDLRPLGLLLLIVGLIGITASALLAAHASFGPWWPRRTHTDQHPGATA